jgi:hypothetical protein
MRPSFSTTQGYSLIETVVYVGLITTMLVVSITSVTSVYRTFGSLKTERKISLNGDFAMETMIRDIRLATSTVSAGSVFGQSSGALRIGTTTYSLVGTSIERQIDGNSSTAITGSGVRVTSLIFYHATSAISEIVSIQMHIEAGSGVYARSKKYFGSAVLRGAYK